MKSSAISKIGSDPGRYWFSAKLHSVSSLWSGLPATRILGQRFCLDLGGIWIEALDDVAVRIAPFTEEEAASMFDELRGRALLDGARGRPGVNRAAIAHLLASLSQWIARAPWLAELDLNPIIASGSNLIAVDARLRIVSSANTELGR